MGKRVVDESSLQQLGDAIRAKTGGTAALEFPAGMADAISGITTGPDITILEDQPFMLDFSAGDMYLDLGETMAVRSGIIYKPADLLPENIRDGVQIAGITGTMAAGGTGSLPADVHQVTFMDGSEVLYVRSVADGDNCADPVQRDLIDAPAKASTVDTVYTHSGWSLADDGTADSNALSAVTADRTVYATYTSAVRYYTITFYDADGETVLKTEQMVYGEMPSYTPEKDGHKFTGWEPALSEVSGDISYTAQWIEMLSLETTTWPTIAEKAASGEAANVFALGDTKTMNLTLADGSTHTVLLEIAGFNHDTLEDGSKAAITFITKKVYLTDSSGTNEINTIASSISLDGSTWSTCKLRTWMSGTLLNRFPADLIPLVKPVQKSALYNSIYTRSTIDKVWLPSVNEMTGNTPYSTRGEIASKYPLYTNAASRVRFGGYNSMTSAIQGACPLRSSTAKVSQSSYDNNYATLAADGYVSGSMSKSSNGVTNIIFGFCI